MKKASDARAPITVMLILSGALGCSAGASPIAGSGGNGGETSTSTETSTGSASTGSTNSGGTGTGGGASVPPLPECRLRCTVAADCDTGNGTLYDADNWSCNAGACEETGCNTNQECIDYFKDPQKICTTEPGYSLKRCVTKCAVAADCVPFSGTLYDEDNWACNTGLCRYLGCKTSQECLDAHPGTNYVCTPSLAAGDGCLRTCSAAADCKLANFSLYDEDNFICKAGLCESLGCNSTQECDDFFKKPTHVCK